jgi:hypothetical protein
MFVLAGKNIERTCIPLQRQFGYDQCLQRARQSPGGPESKTCWSKSVWGQVLDANFIDEPKLGLLPDAITVVAGLL